VRLSCPMRPQSAPQTPDWRLAEIAGRQHGVITTAQLTRLAFDSRAVTRRLDSGRLHRIHRGVYAVGHSCLSQEGRWMAAVLACGRRGILSHRAAAALWRLLPPTSGAIDVMVLGAGGRRPRPGIRRHRTSSLPENEITRRRGIPVTTPGRTITDLRRTVPGNLLRAAIRQAAVEGLDISEVTEVGPTRSELEERFLRICQRHRLPAPEVNVAIGSLTVDFLWRDRGLVVETDGYRFHRGRQAFEDDRARDVALRLRGLDVVRFSYRQVSEEPRRVAAALRALLRLS
jgi:very-short-patch-repair endonuclease